MAVTKAEKFNQTQIRIAELAKALSHPARIAILQLLAARDTCICGDITEELPLAQSTISQHLKALKKSGIIQGNIEGVKVCYCLDEETVQEFEGLISAFGLKLKTSTQKSCC